MTAILFEAPSRISSQTSRGHLAVATQHTQRLLVLDDVVSSREQHAQRRHFPGLRVLPQGGNSFKPGRPSRPTQPSVERAFSLWCFKPSGPSQANATSLRDRRHFERVCFKPSGPSQNDAIRPKIVNTNFVVAVSSRAAHPGQCNNFSETSCPTSMSFQAERPIQANATKS